MKSDRRGFLKGLGGGLLAMGFLREMGVGNARAADKQSGVKVGMTDWNLGGTCNPDKIPLAKEAGLDGLQISVATDPGNVPLRDPAVRRKYLEMSDKHGIAICSVAAGSILNSIPLATEPQSAVYVIDAVEAAKALGADNILMAFFGNGDLRLKDAQGNVRNISEDPKWKEYELDTQGVTRVVEALRQIAPRAEDAGVILGLENTISAKQNLEIIERVGSPMLQVYYDVGNSTGNGYNVPAEIRMLGKQRICEVHLKDWGTPMLGSSKAQVDMKACAEALKEIGYEKWYVLETSGRDRKKSFVEDTRANVAFVKKTFA